LLALHLPKSHTEAIMRVPQIVTYMVASGERDEEQRKTMVNFRMQILKLLQLAKDTSQDKAMLNSEEIKPVT